MNPFCNGAIFFYNSSPYVALVSIPHFATIYDISILRTKHSVLNSSLGNLLMFHLIENILFHSTMIVGDAWMFVINLIIPLSVIIKYIWPRTNKISKVANWCSFLVCTVNLLVTNHHESFSCSFGNSLSCQLRGKYRMALLIFQS